MTILDTNVWVALFNQADSLHGKAVLTAPKLSRPLIVPELIIGEVCAVLIRTADKNAADTFIRYLNETDDVQLLANDINTVQETTTFFTTAPHNGLSYVDIALLYLASIYSVTTFDKKLAQAIAKQSKK